MLKIEKALGDTSLVVENMFCLQLVKSGFTVPYALTDSFNKAGRTILKALDADVELLSGELDILEFLNESSLSGWLIEVSMPSAYGFCFDSNNSLIGYTHDFSALFTAFFYCDTLNGCILKAINWHDDHIQKQIALELPKCNIAAIKTPS